MAKNRITLKEAIKFHGHLGPYLVLGILAGEEALRKLKCKKYFGLAVKVRGAAEKPKSCLIDGLQLSCGATYGKGNIKKAGGSLIKIEFRNKQNSSKIVFDLKDELQKKLEELKTHSDSERFAKKLYKSNLSELFNLRLTT